MADDFRRARPRLRARPATWSTTSSTATSPSFPPCTGVVGRRPVAADISIARNARIIDGPWPAWAWRPATTHCLALLCGMAKAKYYLMLCETVSGEEAGAHRPGAVRGRGRADRQGFRWLKAGRRLADRDPLDQVFAEQLAAHGRPQLRYLAGTGVHGLCRPGSRSEPNACASAARRTSGLTRRFEPALPSTYLKNRANAAWASSVASAELLGFIVQRGLDGPRGPGA